MTEHRFYPEPRGDFVHVRVFSGPEGRGVCNGKLIFSREEWESFKRGVKVGKHFMDEIWEGNEEETAEP